MKGGKHMTKQEAYSLVTRKCGKDYVKTYAYANGEHLFGVEDPDIYIVVDDNTEKIRTISYMRTVLFDKVEDRQYCDELQKAVSNAKPITTKVLKEAV